MSKPKRLSLTRHLLDDAIIITESGEVIRVVVTKIFGKSVILTFEANEAIQIHRGERLKEEALKSAKQ